MSTSGGDPAIPSAGKPDIAPTGDEFLNHYIVVIDRKDFDSKRCSICFDDFEEQEAPDVPVRATRCGHVFGRACLEKWIKSTTQHNHDRCPICRSRWIRCEDDPSVRDGVLAGEQDAILTLRIEYQDVVAAYRRRAVVCRDRAASYHEMNATHRLRVPLNTFVRLARLFENHAETYERAIRMMEARYETVESVFQGVNVDPLLLRFDLLHMFTILRELRDIYDEIETSIRQAEIEIRTIEESALAWNASFSNGLRYWMRKFMAIFVIVWFTAALMAILLHVAFRVAFRDLWNWERRDPLGL